MDSVNRAFVELRGQIRGQGLLESSSAFYIRRAIVALVLVGASITILITTTNFWIQMANAILLAFTFGQLGLFFHDVGHGQVTGARWHKVMNICFSVMLGWNLDWWVYKHNRHHAFPNQPGYDPDIGINFLAFSQNQAREKRGPYRTIAHYQDILFVPILLGESWHIRCASIKYLFQQRTIKAAIGLFLIAVHIVTYGALLLFFLPLWTALAFALVHWGLLGVYLGLTFAPNHKGMPMMEHGAVVGYLEQQVLTARNVRGGWLVDMLYGGLNYQIEHHLFPSMPRNHLKHAALIVEKFCRERRVSYAAVSVRESFREIFGHLGRVGRSLETTG